MNFKDFLNEALSKGENIKEELLSDLLSSKILHEVLSNDLFVKAVSSAIKTKEEVAKVIKDNVKTVLKIMDIPSRNDLVAIKHKLEHLEKVIDRIGKKGLTSKSLSTIQFKKAAKKKRK